MLSISAQGTQRACDLEPGAVSTLSQIRQSYPNPFQLKGDLDEKQSDFLSRRMPGVRCS